jgi:ribonuclease Y
MKWYAYILIVAALGIGFFIGNYLKEKMNKETLETAQQTAARLVEEAIKEGEAIKKEKIVEAKDEIYSSKKDFDKEVKDRRNELSNMEKRLQQKEENVEKKQQALDKRDELTAKKLKEIEAKEEKVEKLHQQQIEELEKISKLTFEEAREILLDDVEKRISRETALYIKNKESEAKEEADKKAREIITYAIQRCAADHVSESTVSVVNLPGDEMKGRIIGREGRNIRALETLTGVDLIIDDTPEAVILSSFDPVRREIARVALERLIVDGRIHPARIEEMVKKAETEIQAKIKEMGEQALFETNVMKMHPELVKLIGRLNYRTSYGQNVLKHSIEVSQLAGIMADELGANSRIARRAGILHDIGKGLDHEIEGPHVQIGVDMLKKYKESKEVIHAVEAHHNDVEPTTLEAVLVQAADAISAARPGARREALESYTKRLEKLEAIANSYEGVEKSFAIQAGREIRVMVKPEKVGDLNMVHVARDIAKQIENSLEYPGQIKVNIIRETRAVEYAK